MLELARMEEGSDITLTCKPKLGDALVLAEMRKMENFITESWHGESDFELAELR